MAPTLQGSGLGAGVYTYRIEGPAGVSVVSFVRYRKQQWCGEHSLRWLQS
jgi:hypothetical protein